MVISHHFVDISPQGRVLSTRTAKAGMFRLYCQRDACEGDNLRLRDERKITESIS